MLNQQTKAVCRLEPKARGGITLREPIPQGHKGALAEIEAGTAVIAMESGSVRPQERSSGAACLLHEDQLRVPTPPVLDELPVAPSTVAAKLGLVNDLVLFNPAPVT